MKPSLKHLIDLKVRYGTYENELYFDVEELRQIYPHLRFPPDKIRKVSNGTIFFDGIRQQDIKELNEFEKNIMKFYNFKK